MTPTPISPGHTLRRRVDYQDPDYAREYLDIPPNKMIDWSKIRAEFPALSNRVFLDAACVSLLPERARVAVEELNQRLTQPTARDATQHHIWMDEQREAALPQVARMLDCPLEQVALIESTTQGLNIATQSIPWQDGDEILLCDLEYLQVAIPFVKLAERRRVKPVFVRHRHGVAGPDQFRAALTPRTRAIVVSSTQWANGYRVDLSGLAELARSVKAWLIVDAIQQAGAVPAHHDGVDFIISGGHKWLNAPLGTGFLYVSKRVLEELEPAAWGYLSLLPPEGGWGNYFTTPTITPDRKYDFVRTARRFETGGTANYPGAVALARSLEIINGAGMGNISARVWTLGERLIEGLRRLPVNLQTPFPASQRAGIISFTLGSREADTACAGHLIDARIFVGQRYTSGVGGVRISVHFFNNEEDIDQLLEVTRGFLSRRV